MSRYLFFILIVLLLVPTSLTLGEDPTSLRETIKRAIPYLQMEGQAWIDKRGCVSCHQVPFMVWSLRSAKEAGFEVDENQLRNVSEWAVEIANFGKPEDEAQQSRSESETAAANIDTLAQLLLALPSRDLTTAANWPDKYSSFLKDNQKKDGTWKPCGQLPFQKRPKAETTEVTTLWTLLALKQNSEIELQHPWSSQLQEEPVSTEWWAVQLLSAIEANDEERITRLRNQLLKLQREDGGWGWLTTDDSDAFGTGISLYALSQSGIDRDVPEVRLAVQFLKQSQGDNGSWPVRSTKARNQQKVTPTATYWGTAWAVIGLSELL